MLYVLQEEPGLAGQGELGGAGPLPGQAGGRLLQLLHPRVRRLAQLQSLTVSHLANASSEWPRRISGVEDVQCSCLSSRHPELVERHAALLCAAGQQDCVGCQQPPAVLHLPSSTLANACS